MADRVRLVRVTRREVGYLNLSEREIERVVTAEIIDGDLLLDIPGRVVEWNDEYPLVDIVADPDRIPDWHIVPAPAEGGDDRG